MSRLFHILDFADSHPSPCAVFSLDAEKAFDRLEWNYMWAVLQCFGFGEHFISMIKTLYHSPAASVLTGNIISPPPVPSTAGNEAGMSTFPLIVLFFSLEPLAQALKRSEVLIKIHDHNHTLTKIINATLLFLPPFFMSWTQRSKTFSMYTKGLFLSNIVHKSV